MAVPLPTDYSGRSYRRCREAGRTWECLRSGRYCFLNEHLRHNMYHYKTCGLDDIYLENGYKEIETAEGKAVSIHDMDGLHRAIAKEIVGKPRRLSGKEIRFLRVELDMSQRTLGDILGKTDQTVAKWEKEHVKIPKMADLILRKMYMESVDDQSKIKQMIERINTLDQKIQEKALHFSESEEGWKSVNTAGASALNVHPEHVFSTTQLSQTRK